MNLKYLVLSAALFLRAPALAQTPTHSFSRTDVLADLDYLYAALQDAHYDVHAYTSKEAQDAVYAREKAAINEDSLALLAVINTYQRLVAAVNNGHTEISFPIASYIGYAQAGGTLFPLEVAVEDGKYYIRKNFSAAEDILPGDELLRINGQPIEEVMARIHQQISAERPYFKNVKMELYSFPRYYWQVFGQQDTFEVVIKAGGREQPYTLPAVSLIEGFEAKREELLSDKRILKLLPEAAYLNPGNLSGDEQKYQQFIDSAFAVIQQANSANLIIDLRNNGGGNDSFSDYFVSYIADQPFYWCKKLTLKTSSFLKEHVRRHNDTTAAYFRAILDHPDGSYYAYEFEPYQPQPAAKRFKGKVYVLVNRQSHSQSAVAAAQMQDYGFATIAGEETGDYPSLYASQYQFELPRTGVVVHVAKGFILRVSGEKESRGVIPDIMIRDHLLDENDEIMDHLLKTLNDKH